MHDSRNSLDDKYRLETVSSEGIVIPLHIQNDNRVIFEDNSEPVIPHKQLENTTNA